MNLFQQLKERYFPDIQHLPKGVHQYQAPPDADFPYRLHLRLEGNGEGTLIVNASTVLHLNPSAAEYVYHLIHQTPVDEMSRKMAKRYRVSRQQATQDFQDIISRLHALVDLPDLDPVTFFDFERADPYSSSISAPYRLDCAITYKVEEKSAKDSAPLDRVTKELNTEEWKTILEKAWNAGIPHIVFTGGEPTLRDDLCDLIAHSEDLGQVTGVLTDGLHLSDKDYLNSLLQSGLDHLMIVLDPDNKQAWRSIETVMPEDIFTTVHITVTKQNISKTEQVLDRLVKLGVTSLSLSVNDPSLNQGLQDLRQSAEKKELSLTWDIPVPYSKLNPVALELEGGEITRKNHNKAWLYVEPDGDVLLAQGLPDAIGNLLSDSWEDIWSKVPD